MKEPHHNNLVVRNLSFFQGIKTFWLAKKAQRLSKDKFINGLIEKGYHDDRAMEIYEKLNQTDRLNRLHTVFLYLGSILLLFGAFSLLIYSPMIGGTAMFGAGLLFLLLAALSGMVVGKGLAPNDIASIANVVSSISSNKGSGNEE